MYPGDLMRQDHENTTFRAENIVSALSVRLIMESVNPLKRESETKSCFDDQVNPSVTVPGRFILAQLPNFLYWI